MTLDDFRARLEAGGCNPRGSSAKCPAHDDRAASLSFTRGENAAVVVKCHAGCDVDAILSALSLARADLFDDAPREIRRHAERKDGNTVVALYDYVDEDGALLYQAVRMVDANGDRAFRQRRADGRGGWIWNLTDTRRVLYRLPEIIRAKREGAAVWIAEGEKDVHALEASGVVATTAPMGAAAAWLPDFTEALTGLGQVVIWADKDTPGIAHAEKVAAALEPVVGRLSIVTSVIGKDAAEHLGAGRSLEDVEALVGRHPFARSSWSYMDLGPFLDGTAVELAPTMLARTDGRHLLYPGHIHLISAEPESGKGWMMLAACWERLNAGEHVAYLDFEDTPRRIVERMVALGVESDVIRERFHYIQPHDALTRSDRAELEALLARDVPTVCVVDGVTEVFSLHGWSIKENDDVAAFLRDIARMLRTESAAIVLLDHVTKDRESRGRYAIGGQHKLAGVDVAYKLDVTEPFRRGGHGWARITVDKDRPGYVRGYALDGKRLGALHLESIDDGSEVLWYIDPAKAGEGEGGERQVEIMTRVSEVLEATTSPLTKRSLYAAVGKSKDDVDAAVLRLEALGCVMVDRKRGGHAHRFIRPYPDAGPAGGDEEEEWTDPLSRAA